MTEQSFYERYWRQQPAYKGKGVAELPPEWNEENLERILKFCSDKIQGRVLDVGCVDGFFTAQILQRFNLKNVYSLKSVFFKKSTLADILSKNGFSIIKYSWNGDYLKIMPKGQMILAQKLI